MCSDANTGCQPMVAILKMTSILKIHGGQYWFSAFIEEMFLVVNRFWITVSWKGCAGLISWSAAQMKSTDMMYWLLKEVNIQNISNLYYRLILHRVILVYFCDQFFTLLQFPSLFNFRNFVLWFPTANGLYRSRQWC